MKNSEKMWGLILHLGPNGKTTPISQQSIRWDDAMFDWILDEMPKAGMNTLIIEINGGVEYGSHPEIACPGAWSRHKLRKVLKKVRDAGITPIPEFNCSAVHSSWLNEYYYKTSTPEYYRVMNELIREAYELFDHPKYIHLGMDEESFQYAERDRYVMFRQKDLYWHDLRFIVDSVIETGATPWMWTNPLFDHPEEFAKHFEPDELILSPYHFNALRRDHWTPITTRSEYLVYYNEDRYKEMGIEFVEQDPFLQHFMEVAIPLMEKGYKYVPCGSVFNRCDYNHSDLMEYFKQNAPDDQILGFVTAPWERHMPENKGFFEETFKFFKEAKDKFYPDK